MKRLLLLLSFLLPGAFIYSQSTYEGYKLVWNDDFEIDGKPDSTKWTYEYGFVRNQEQQWYQAQNAFVEDGLLKIVGKREMVQNHNYDKNSTDWRKKREYANYSSASVVTTSMHSWQYGLFEVRAKFHAVKGSWSAIWFLGDKMERPWSLYGKTDLMEYFRIDDVPHHILANACWGNQEWNDAKIHINHFLEKDKDWENKFHVCKMDRAKDYIRLYLNNELFNEIDLSKTINHDGINPFHLSQNMLINLAIGGIGESTDKTSSPIIYEIDYVRIYQKIE
jgi:beta-glucanase (GH16 family)